MTTTSVPAVVTAVRGNEFDFEENGVTWTIEVSAPQLPVLTMGEAVHLDVHAYADNAAFHTTTIQFIAVTRGTDLVLFGVTGAVRQPVVADFVMRGLSAPIRLTSAGVSCRQPGSICGRAVHTAQVFVSGSTVDIAASTTGTLGPFDITVGAYEGIIDNGFCDGKGFTSVVGVRVR